MDLDVLKVAVVPPICCWSGWKVAASVLSFDSEWENTSGKPLHDFRMTNTNVKRQIFVAWFGAILVVAAIWRQIASSGEYAMRRGKGNISIKLDLTYGG